MSSSGTHLVEFRSTDKAANTEETKSVTFKVQLPVCDRSDEFDGQGTDLLPRWLRHDRNGGTPTTGALAPTLTGTGQLSLPTNNFELDAAATATALGPVNFIGQDLNALGDAWQVETQFTARYTAGWQHVGLIVWQSDGNFFRSTLTHSLSGGNLYVEQSKDTPSATPEGVRQTGGGNVDDRAQQGRGDHDQDALHARLRLQQRPGPVPGHRPGRRRERRLGQLPGHGDGGLDPAA